jgi:hypothetical protein
MELVRFGIPVWSLAGNEPVHVSSQAGPGEAGRAWGGLSSPQAECSFVH